MFDDKDIEGKFQRDAELPLTRLAGQGYFVAAAVLGFSVFMMHLQLRRGDEIVETNLVSEEQIQKELEHYKSLEPEEEIGVQWSETEAMYVATPVKGPTSESKLITISEYAPVEPKAKDITTQEFISRWSRVAKSHHRKHGVLPSIKMAQAIVESRSGNSKLARQNNNHFGVKCFSKSCGKGHCTNHFDDHHKDFFRKYTNAEESWEDHSRKLADNGRYKKLFTYGTDYKKWANGLQAAGYATDKRYATTLIRTIEKYRLHELDK